MAVVDAYNAQHLDDVTIERGEFTCVVDGDDSHDETKLFYAVSNALQGEEFGFPVVDIDTSPYADAQPATLDEFRAEGGSRETSDEIMDAIASLAGDDVATAVRIWEAPTPEELLSVWETVTRNGLRDASDYCWGAEGSRWHSGISGRSDPQTGEDEAARAGNVLAQQIIDDSVMRNEIVNHEHSDALMSALIILCDDHVENGAVHEFWGTRDDGADWRVHLDA